MAKHERLSTPEEEYEDILNELVDGVEDIHNARVGHNVAAYDRTTELVTSSIKRLLALRRTLWNEKKLIVNTRKKAK